MSAGTPLTAASVSGLDFFAQGTPRGPLGPATPAGRVGVTAMLPSPGLVPLTSPHHPGTAPGRTPARFTFAGAGEASPRPVQDDAAPSGMSALLSFLGVTPLAQSTADASAATTGRSLGYGAQVSRGAVVGRASGTSSDRASAVNPMFEAAAAARTKFGPAGQAPAAAVDFFAVVQPAQTASSHATVIDAVTLDCDQQEASTAALAGLAIVDDDFVGNRELT
jgi:hypothetical protein